MNDKINTTIIAAIIGSFAAIFSSIIFAYAKLPDWSIALAFILLIIQLYVILSIAGIFKSLLKIKQKMHETKLAKKFFDEFKQDDYVGKFHLIQSTADGVDTYRYQTFHKVIDLIRQRDYFRELQSPNLKSIRTHFRFWKGCYNRFNGKDASGFEILLNDFGAVVYEYYSESVAIPLESVKNITQRAKEKKEPPIVIENSLREEWRIAMGYYDDFEKRYNHYVERVNAAFNRSVLSGIPPARDILV